MPLDFQENSIDWQHTEILKGTNRIIRSIGYRKSQARLRRELSPSMLDASREIDRAYEDREKKSKLGAKTVNLLAIGGGLSMAEEIMDAVHERITGLIKWERACTPFLRETVYALNQHGYTATTYAAQQSKKTLEIVLWYKEGLRVYCKLKGWE